jgi:nitrogen fixation NifU-like protein
MEYSEAVLAHFRRPRNARGFPTGVAGVVSGTAGSRARGREIRLELRFGTDGRVAECRYRVYGCPATIALCSLLSERLENLTPAEASSLSGIALAEELALPATKRDAALLLEDALRAVLAGAGYNMTERRERA